MIIAISLLALFEKKRKKTLFITKCSRRFSGSKNIILLKSNGKLRCCQLRIIDFNKNENKIKRLNNNKNNNNNEYFIMALITIAAYIHGAHAALKTL